MITALKRMEITAIPLFKDNYCYKLRCLSTDLTCLVDPALVSALDHAPELDSLFITHHHADHQLDVPLIAKQRNVKVYAGDDRIFAPLEPGKCHPIEDGVPFTFGKLKVVPIRTPCHTSGSVSFLVQDLENGEQVVFTGDTLFRAGCGRFFEGDAKDMHQSLLKLSKLDAHTLVFCGHEYTLSNLKFALSVDPDNEKIKSEIEWAEKTTYTMPSTIGTECLTNPFMRVWLPEFQKSHSESDPVSLMHKIRELKNNA